MSDRYLLEEPRCKKCGEDLSDIPLFISGEDGKVLTCPKCGTKTKFWLKVKFKDKIVK